MLSLSDNDAYLFDDWSERDALHLIGKPKFCSFLEKEMQDEQMSADDVRVEILRQFILVKINDLFDRKYQKFICTKF